MNMRRVALVTGSNRGIGYAVVRKLCKEFDGDVILTARSESSKDEACSALKEEGIQQPVFHQLDVTKHDSILRLKDFLQNRYGGLDVLVNNAGVKLEKTPEIPYPERVEEVIRTNFFGCFHILQELLPLLRPHARVVNVSSRLAVLAILSDDLQKKFLSTELTQAALVELMEQYIRCVREGSTKTYGWEKDLTGLLAPLAKIPSAYAISKIGLTSLTQILARKLSLDLREDILINACCPGWIVSGIGGPYAPRTVTEGAEFIVPLATIPPGDSQSPQGQFFLDNRAITWSDMGKE